MEHISVPTERCGCLGAYIGNSGDMFELKCGTS